MKPMFCALIFAWLLLPGSGLLAQSTPNLTGTWHAKEHGFTMILVLRPDGTGTFDDEAIKYKIIGNKLAITEDGEINNYTFTLKGNSLTLSGGDLDQPMIFERQGAAPATGLEAKRNQAAARASADTEPATNSLVGRWQGPESVVQINDNGTIIIGGETFRYAVASNVITITGSDGSLPIPFELKGDTLAVSVNGQPQTLKRIKNDVADKGSAGSVTAELAGKWCYFSNFNANAGGGRMTNECFTLNADGTYEYRRESSSSASAPGIYGGTASQTSDSGRWTATATSITAQSRNGQSNTYTRSIKRNNKNNDPMLCLNGQCFVTGLPKSAMAVTTPIDLCYLPQLRLSITTKSSCRLAKAAWAKCTVRVIRG